MYTNNQTNKLMIPRPYVDANKPVGVPNFNVNTNYQTDIYPPPDYKETNQSVPFTPTAPSNLDIQNANNEERPQSLIYQNDVQLNQIYPNVNVGINEPRKTQQPKPRETQENQTNKLIIPRPYLDANKPVDVPNFNVNTQINQTDIYPPPDYNETKQSVPFSPTAPSNLNIQNAYNEERPQSLIYQNGVQLNPNVNVGINEPRRTQEIDIQINQQPKPRETQENQANQQLRNELGFKTKSIIHSGGVMKKASNDYLCLSIFTCLFCSWLFGLVAIVFSAKTRKHNSRGHYNDAKTASKTALIMIIISLIIGITCFIIVGVGLGVFFGLFYWDIVNNNRP